MCSSLLFCLSLDKAIKNREKYEDWQNNADDLDKWFVETKEEVDKCKVPCNDVSERERQNKFLNVSTKEKESMMHGWYAASTVWDTGFITLDPKSTTWVPKKLYEGRTLPVIVLSAVIFCYRTSAKTNQRMRNVFLRL